MEKILTTVLKFSDKECKTLVDMEQFFEDICRNLNRCDKCPFKSKFNDDCLKRLFLISLEEIKDSTFFEYNG